MTNPNTLNVGRRRVPAREALYEALSTAGSILLLLVLAVLVLCVF